MEAPMRSMTHAFAVALVAATALATLAAQSAPAPPQGRGRGGPPPVRPQPLAIADHTGFESIFDGTTLKGWDGDPAFWTAAGGTIVGESWADPAGQENTVLQCG